ncbi:MAG: hypothetical protein H0U84_05885 [Thermoleophilaceae bacterium]|nr:hypothetical protein [Thermoleophilaceae bacterium]
MKSYYRFEANSRIYVTATEPGTEGRCIARPVESGRGHPSYKTVVRSIPATAEKVDPPKTIKKLLKSVEA